MSHLGVEVGQGGVPAVCVVQPVPVARGVHHSQGEPHSALLQLDLNTKHRPGDAWSLFLVANTANTYMTKSLDEIQTKK